MTIRLIHMAALGFAAASGILEAQEPAKESSLMVRAVLHDPSKPDSEFFFGRLGDAGEPVKLTSEGLGEAQKWPVENGNLNLFSSAKVDKNKPLANLAATVKVPTGQGRAIVVILPAGKATPPYRLVLIPDDPKTFPWGQSKAVNLTPTEFAIEAGEHKLPLPSGKVTEIPKVTKVDEFNRAQTNFYFKQDKRWAIAAERQMQYLPALRRVFLIYQSPGALAPDVRTIVDQLPANPTP